MLNIGGLNEGVVIDHIKAGGAMEIYHYLNLEKLDCSVAIIKNAKSNKSGKKDIIKIDGPLDIDLNMLGVLDPNITINIIENGKIIEKSIGLHVCGDRNWKCYLAWNFNGVKRVTVFPDGYYSWENRIIGTCNSYFV